MITQSIFHLLMEKCGLPRWLKFFSYPHGLLPCFINSVLASTSYLLDL